MRKVKIMLLLTLATLVVGCSPDPITWAVTDVDALGWKPEDSAVVVLNNEKKESVNELDLVFRVTEDFDQDYFIVTVGVESPNGHYAEEEMAVRVRMDQKMKESYKELTIPYRSGVVLEQEGEYKFTIAPTSATVKGVSAVGVKLTTFK